MGPVSHSHRQVQPFPSQALQEGKKKRKTQPHSLGLQKEANLNPASLVKTTSWRTPQQQSKKHPEEREATAPAAVSHSQDCAILFLPPITVFLWFSCFPFCSLSWSPRVSIKVAFPHFSFSPAPCIPARKTRTDGAGWP